MMNQSADVHAVFDAARERLVGARGELLGELQANRRTLGVRRAPRIVAVGEAWHVGVLLLTPDAVLATADVTRSLEPARKGYTAISARERDEMRFAAYRGGIAEGRAVHYNWVPVDLATVAAGGTSGPVRLHDGVLEVRWSAAGFAPLERYLAERIDLLLGE